MKPYNFVRVGCLLILAVVTEIVQPTCVLESDFGFKINCAFKKAGLFRVRNLGGVKAHVGIGFSLGDELGFEQSLTNQDPSRRRSVSLKSGMPTNGITDTVNRTGKQEKRGKQNRIMMRPPPPSNRVNPMAMEKLSTLHRRASSTTMAPIVVSPTNLGPINDVPRATIAKPYPMGVPPFKPLPPKEDTLKVLPITATTRRPYSPLQVPQSKGPALAYQSENYSYHRIPHYEPMASQTMTAHMPYQPGLLRITPTPIIVSNTPRVYHKTTVHPFIPMPVAAPPTQAISFVPAPVFKDSVQIPLAQSMLSKVPTAYSLAQNTISIRKSPDPIYNFVDPVPQHVHQLANQLQPYGVKKVDDYNSISGYGDDTTLKFSKEDINEKIAEIAKIGNISMEAVEAAIMLRQQQLLNQYANIPMPTTTTTTTTTTTEEPPPLPMLPFMQEPEPEIEVVQPPSKPKRQQTSAAKVMNAPKDYYPVGYEKNFDDQFQSKVDLPETSFHCGDQKYFPGLYGDENLGCMVFHVCALTDDGLVMKSFLCPESTLFDQTILKCNWWFYVDCKSTRKLYDTNIPVSKSYQLMKALTFFSSYKKDMDESAQNTKPEEIDGIKEAITILENQEGPKSDGVQIVTPQPSPVYRANRNFRNSTTNKNSIRNSTKTKDIQSSESEVNYVTVKPESTKDVSSTENVIKSTSAESSKERLYRRRLTTKTGRSSLRPVSTVVYSSTSTSTTTTTTTTEQPTTTIKQTTAKPYQAETTTAKPTTPSVEIIKLNIQPIEKLLNNYTESYQAKQESLIDQIADSKVTGPESFAPIRRFHRSSAESKEEVTVGKEKVQIIRPTSKARLVGEYATPVSAIAKLDEAVLGRRKKEVPRISIVTAKAIRDSSRERT